MDPRHFEEYIYFVFSDLLGYEVALTAKTRDGGKDLICIDANEGKVLVEVKRRPKIGISIIREFIGALVLHKEKRGAIVTSGEFTSGAKYGASWVSEVSQIDLSLFDFEAVCEWSQIIEAKHTSSSQEHVTHLFRRLDEAQAAIEETILKRDFDPLSIAMNEIRKVITDFNGGLTPDRPRILTDWELK